jgi:glycosyltransferase involved in cell wall biosynthesis
VRVVLYTHTAYFEPALGLIRTLSQHVELHVLLEVSPRAWQLAGFDVHRMAVQSGVVEGDALLAGAFPPAVRGYWAQARSFHLVVHNARRFYAPGSWAVTRAALRFIRGVSPDVVHLDSAPLRLSLMSPVWPAVPLVLSEHDPRPHRGESDWRVELARRLTYGRVGHFILHAAAGRHVFQQRYKVPKERVTVVPLAANDVMRAWLGAPVKPDDRTVLFFGRLSPYKGLEVLFAAMERVTEWVPGVRLIVAGRPVGGYRLQHLPRLSRGGQLELIEDHVSNAHLVDLCQRATVVACPYVEASQSAVVLTAFALGTPVVASAVGGLPEYVDDGETGLLVPPGDADALARALTRVLEDATLRGRLRAGIARGQQGHLGWSRSARMTLEVYEAALASRR